jgi:hypothetical protein
MLVARARKPEGTTPRWVRRALVSASLKGDRFATLDTDGKAALMAVRCYQRLSTTPSRELAEVVSLAPNSPADAIARLDGRQYCGPLQLALVPPELALAVRVAVPTDCWMAWATMRSSSVPVTAR